MPFGRLDVGATADICLFDPDACWIPGPDTLVSRGHNTPFAGVEMQGRVRFTLLGGRLVFQNDAAQAPG